MTNIFLGFYKDKNPDRSWEYVRCLQMNYKSGADTLNIICDTEYDLEHYNTKIYPLLSHIEGVCNISVYTKNKRPTFNDFIEGVNSISQEHDLNIIINADVYFKEIFYLKAFYDNLTYTEKTNTALALSRWDLHHDGTATHFNRADSQDTWVFYGKIRFKCETEYSMGMAGCDNKFAYEIEKAGYKILNPSSKIKTYHYHLTSIRNYLNESGVPVERIPPPYKLVTPY